MILRLEVSHRIGVILWIEFAHIFILFFLSSSLIYNMLIIYLFFPIQRRDNCIMNYNLRPFVHLNIMQKVRVSIVPVQLKFGINKQRFAFLE